MSLQQGKTTTRFAEMERWWNGFTLCEYWKSQNGKQCYFPNKLLKILKNWHFFLNNH